MINSTFPPIDPYADAKAVASLQRDVSILAIEVILHPKIFTSGRTTSGADQSEGDYSVVRA